MANLMVAGVCDLDCPYCFAREHMQAVKASHTPAFLSLEDFEARLDLLDRLGINEARLIGGEPTLHPQFPELVQRARQRGKRIAVFSHARMPEAALDCLAALPEDVCSVLANLNATGRQPGNQEREFAQRRGVMERLGPRLQAGFNIYQVDFNADDLLPLIIETGAHKSLRLGLAQPVLDGHNQYLHPKQYPLVGAKIVTLAQKAHALGIRLEFDCGFVRCMFSDAGFAALQQAEAATGFHCGPVPDIDLDGQALHCFPLASRVTAPIGCIINLDELINALSAQTRHQRVAGIYRECSACRFKQSGECTGGCMAHTLPRFRRSSHAIPWPENMPIHLD